ncbi:MAG: YqeG family HAD IIIA-type phosphatase [Clostridia bacterium]|nr:YqeG family HAD IIIA-type phosphatase [Clostridia bacterium]
MGLTPTERQKRIFDISVSKLIAEGIKLVLVDLDNTLAPWHSFDVDEKTASWVKSVQEAGIKVVILTNSRGKYAFFIGNKLDLQVVNNAKKPFPFVTKQLIKALGFLPQETLMVGDQLFTDIALANSLKTKSVLTEPISSNEWWCTKVFNRSREKLVWRFIFKD